MKTSTLLVIYAAISLIFGIGFLIAPNLILSVYGLELDALGIFLARILGAAMLALAILTWSTRNIGPSEARNAIVLSLFVFESLGFVLSLIAQLAGVLGQMGWSFVILFLIFAVALGYARFFKPEAE
jgi:hypothetical protein